PICFPWFGPNGPQDDSPAHGFARTRAWTLSNAALDPGTGDISLNLTLSSNDETRALWPHDFRFDYTLRIGRTLHLVAEIANTGQAPLSCELALHTYFRVADVGGVRISGLAGHEFIDQLEADA